MIHQIAGETAGCIVTGEAPSEEWSALIEISRLRGDPETPFPHRLNTPCGPKGNRLRNDPEGYLRDLERFFNFGIRHCHRLWYAVLVEWVDFCHEVDTGCSR
jgi:hypothetical protein